MTDQKAVLVVEDDAQVRRFMKVLLSAAGMDVGEAPTIADALALAADRKFDLAILDYNLAKGEIGWSVAGKLRADPEAYGNPKIIAVSGTVDQNLMRARFKVDDFDLFLAKPFDTKALLDQIKDLLDISDASE